MKGKEITKINDYPDGKDYHEMLLPLMNLPVTKYRIRFKAEKKWRANGSEKAFRGRIGLRLKENFCRFPEPLNQSCRMCEFTEECLYILLFEPSSSIAVSFKKKNTTSNALPPPFVVALNDSKSELNHTGSAFITLAGPAIRYDTIFVESAVFALSSFPLEILEILPVFPDIRISGPVNTGTAWPLSHWVKENTQEDKNSMTLRVSTPVRLKKNKNLIKNGPSFLLLVQAMIRRLRDLKRAHNMDGDMGNIDNSFYEMARNVSIVEDKLKWSLQKRFSSRQLQDVVLDGLTGEIRYEGPVDIFYPLFKSAEILHMGKGTASGNGRIVIVDKKPDIQKFS